MILSHDLAIDLGTSNTRVYVKGKGIILREPSVAAIDIKAQPARVVAVGSRAKEMIGRTPGSIIAKRPMRDGVIADYEITAQMLRELIKMCAGNSIISRARVVLSIPSGVTEVERRAFHEAARNAGARYVSIIDETMAAAIGADLPVSDAVGTMVVNIGGGTSEVAVLSLGDVVAANSIRIGGDAMDEAVISYVRKKHSLLIGERTAEDIKIKIGSAAPYEGEGAMDVRGRSLVDGLPKNIEITSAEVREALSDCVSRIIDAIAVTLENTPPELSSDIFDHGITLTGGVAMLKGLPQLIADATGMPVSVAKDPGDCTVNGAGRCLSMKSLYINS